MNYPSSIFLENIRTHKVATADGGWSDFETDAVHFTEWSEAIAFCLCHSFGEVYMVYQIPGKPDLRLNLFDCEMVPAPGISPGASTFGGSRSIN